MTPDARSGSGDPCPSVASNLLAGFLALLSAFTITALLVVLLVVFAPLAVCVIAVGLTVFLWRNG